MNSKQKINTYCFSLIHSKIHFPNLQIEDIKRMIVEGNNSVEKNDNIANRGVCTGISATFTVVFLPFFFSFIFSYIFLVMLICFSRFFSLVFFSCISSFFCTVVLVAYLAAMIMMLIDGTNMTKTKGATTISRQVPIF